jgi:D-alanyl-D-alanine carboxypeptidase
LKNITGHLTGLAIAIFLPCSQIFIQCPALHTTRFQQIWPPLLTKYRYFANNEYDLIFIGYNFCEKNRTAHMPGLISSSERAIRCLVLAAVMTFYYPLHAQETSLEAAFQAELEAIHQKYGFPGATAAYVIANGTVHAASTGMADIESGMAMTPQSRMLAASIGKSFVAATILALAGQGDLKLDSPISKWFADQSWFTHLPNNQTITVRHLLTHSSGLPDHVHMPAYENTISQSWQQTNFKLEPEELVAYVLDQPALFNAGEGWSYTDTGYILLGMIIEQVTGIGYYEGLKRRILDPLGLRLTSPSDHRDLSGLATGYTTEDNALGLPRRTTTAPGVMAWDPAIEWTGGGLVSNPGDLVYWARELYEGRALDVPYLQELLTSVPISPHEPGVQYGAGVAIRKGGPIGPSYGHGGWIPGYISSMRYYPEYHIAVAFQVNTDIEAPQKFPSLNESMELRLASLVARRSGD